MSEALDKIFEAKKLPHITHREERLTAELKFAWQLAEHHDMAAMQLEEKTDSSDEKRTEESWRQLVEQAAELVYLAETSGSWTDELIKEVEEVLAPMAKAAKEYRIICPAHAHIDMNWQWSYDETVMTTIDTLKTMLEILEEYPQFKFSQSQASVYRIVEEYAPQLLEKIRKYVKEGRWEVTASTWVEADKNMPVGESFARHALYTKSYLADLLEIDPDSLDVDFEPDTFGHSQNIPEIDVKSGVKYYYHCRGNDGKEDLYRWRSPSGAELLVYKDPFFYLGYVGYAIADSVVDMAEKTGCKTVLRVYGVGDHGGGPTRRDIERLLEMQKWPIFPEIRLGTFREYFHEVEKIRDTLPVIKGEINFICDGCYSSQSRIKAGNVRSERNLKETEAVTAFAVQTCGFPKKEYRSEWEKVLFQQFHDIITGSGIRATREYACGQFQSVEAATRAGSKQALQELAAHMDTVALISETEKPSSMAAGAGHVQAEAGVGKKRIYHLFNNSEKEFSGCVQVLVWDYEDGAERIQFKDTQGTILESQLLGDTYYWGHTYHEFLVSVDIPAFGYRTVTAEAASRTDIPLGYVKEMRRQYEEAFVLENAYIKAVLDNESGAVISLVDKTTGEEKLDRSCGGARLCIIDEAGEKSITNWYASMSSWFVGRHKKIESITGDIEMVPKASGSLRNSVVYKTKLRNSSFNVEIGLDKDSRDLDFTVHCDWREFGSSEEKIPSLAFFVPLCMEKESYLYDVPFGAVERQPMNIDRPANSFVTASNGVMVMSEARYGYRCVDNSICLKLIRSSTDPDPMPEVGMHDIKFALSLPEHLSQEKLIRKSQAKYLPIAVISGRPHPGTLPADGSFFEHQGDAVISTVKPAENVENGWTLRLYEALGKTAKEELSFLCPVKRAYTVDTTERHIHAELQVDGNTVWMEIPPYQVETVVVEF